MEREESLEKEAELFIWDKNGNLSPVLTSKQLKSMSDKLDLLISLLQPKKEEQTERGHDLEIS